MAADARQLAYEHARVTHLAEARWKHGREREAYNNGVNVYKHDKRHKDPKQHRSHTRQTAHCARDGTRGTQQQTVP